MKLLFNDELAPITRDVGFLRGDCDSAVSEYLKWKTEGKYTKNSVYQQKTVNGTLRDVLLTLLPLQKFRGRLLFVPTKSEWTAYFENSWKGADPDSMVSYLAKRMNSQGVRVLAEPHTIRGEKRDQGRWGGVIFTLYSHDSPRLMNVKRSLALINEDDRWKFYQVGEMLPFEKPEAYQAKRVKQRFTEELLHEYLAALGLFPFDEDFYMPADKGAAILLDSNRPGVTSETFTLEDVKQYT